MTQLFAVPPSPAATPPPAAPPMADSAPRPRHAQLANMALALRTLVDCIEAPAGLPRIGLFSGPSGFGKTVAAAFAAAMTGAVYIEAKSIWTQRTMLEALGEELAIPCLAKTGPAILRQVTEALSRDPRPIIIDEMDHLVKKQSVEIIRDIADSTNIAILLIGEEALPAKLKEWERFDNRVLVAQQAQPASPADALLLRDHYCEQVAIADDLVLYFSKACRQVTRRLVVNLVNAQRIALAEGALAIDRAWWGQRPVLTGDVVYRPRLPA